MNGRLIYVLAFVVYLGVALFVPGDGPVAIMLCAVLAVAVGLWLRRHEDGQQFLLQLFICALLARVIVGTLIYNYRMQVFFGGDANTYDELGRLLLGYWGGDLYLKPYIDRFSTGGGWGMLYMVAGVYAVTGRNMLAIQFVNAVIGAATAPVIYICARQMFQNVRVARIAAVLVAFYPSLVLWSSQGLKDGPIVFLLALSMLATLRLGEKFSLKYAVILTLALFGVWSLRFYIFYMLAAAIGGAFVVGMRAVTTQSLIRQFVIIATIGLGLTYLGVMRTAGTQLDDYANLEYLQRTRADLVRTARSGFAEDVDVSTAGGALMAIPVGMTYLLFAPFPWQMANLRQSITLPEMAIWWGSFPLLVMGLWFTLRYRLRQALPILMFTTLLTLAYSLMQGNVGTAYRQRSQLLVFYFIFVAVGYVLLKERSEDRHRRNVAARNARQVARYGSQKA